MLQGHCAGAGLPPLHAPGALGREAQQHLRHLWRPLQARGLRLLPPSRLLLLLLPRDGRHLFIIVPFPADRHVGLPGPRAAVVRRGVRQVRRLLIRGAPVAGAALRRDALCRVAPARRRISGWWWAKYGRCSRAHNLMLSLSSSLLLPGCEHAEAPGIPSGGQRRRPPTVVSSASVRRLLLLPVGGPLPRVLDAGGPR